MTLEIVDTLECPKLSSFDNNIDNIAILDKDRLPWSPESWTRHKNYQPLSYSLADESLIREHVIPELKAYPPLVAESDIVHLATHLRAMTLGHAPLYSFILQGGYCAESFDDACPKVVNSIIATLKECADTLFPTRSQKCILLPRMAGQYGKPRTQFIEKLHVDDDKVTLSYRGDIFHDFELAHRAPNPARIRQAYHAAQTTLKILTDSYHSTSSPSPSPSPSSCASATFTSISLGQNMFTSHEAFCLPYEEALLRPSSSPRLPLDPLPSQNYDTSGHFLWLGERTSQLDGAHIEFLRGIRNPIGIKLGPKKSTLDLIKLLDRLNPNRIPGKVTLITRLGCSNVKQYLPDFILAVRQSQHPVLWICDPMHGNTQAVTVPMSTSSTVKEREFKTRHFEHILQEIQLTFDMHRSMGSTCSGLHLELTGDDKVTECVGGIDSPISIHDLPKAYTTKCDPRLNRKQVLELMHILKSKFDI